MLPPDPITHNAFRIAKLCLTFTSIFMAFISIFVIVKTRSISKEYSTLLIILIWISMQLDVYTQLIFDPQFIMPMLCIFRDTPILNVPFNAAWGFIVWITLVALHAPIYIACFFHRHQLILPSDSWCKLRPSARLAFLSVTAIPCLSYGYSYYIAWIPPSELILKEISSEWDKSSISRMECFLDYQLLRNVWAFVLFLCGFAFFTILSLHTFAILRSASNLSARTRSYHRIMMLSLIIVAIIPMSLIVVPFAIAMVYYTFVVSDYSIPLIDIASFTIACHSVVHSLALIGTTPALRNRLIELLCGKSTGAVAVPLSTARHSSMTVFHT